MAYDEPVLNIAEIPYDTGELHYRYARYLSTDGAKWIRDGLFQAFYRNGKLASEGTYEHGDEHGLWHDYHENGQLAAEGNYQRGKEVGVWKFWSANGAEEPVGRQTPNNIMNSLSLALTLTLSPGRGNSHPTVQVLRSQRCRIQRWLSFVFLILFVAQLTNSAAAQTSIPPTREEILRGALTPLRTCYDVTSYYLDVRVDPTTQTIKGSNKISFKTVADFEKMQVDLATNMAIEKIIFDDRTPATFTREHGAVFIQLPEKVKKRSEHSVTIYYSGKPQVARRPPWDGGVSWERDTNGNPWVVVTSSETGASLWWPLKDHPADEPDNMTIAITAPAGLDEISNGRLKSKTVLPDGWVRWEWFVSYPINSYCVTFNIGKYVHFDDEYVSADGQKLTLDYYVLPENLEKAKEQFKQVKTMLTVFEKYFGKYPFYRDGYKLIECPHTGMEHQSAIAYGNRYLTGFRGRASSEVGRKFDFIIIHESAHEWWGNSVTMKDMADMWIHESFGAYAESLFVEEQYGRAEALKYINGKKRNVRNARPIISEYGLNRMSNGDMYDKGQLVLNTLRSVLDDDKLWFSMLRGIQQAFKYRNVSADELIAYVNKKSGKNFSYFFEQYYRRANIPTLVVRLEAEDGFVSVRYRWENAVTNFRMPVKVTTAPGKYEFVTPTTEWKTKKLRGLAPEDFKVAEDLFYLKLALSRDSLEPQRNQSP